MDRPKRSHSRQAYRPRGMDAHAWSMPPEPPEDSPGCITRVEFIRHDYNESEAMAQRTSHCLYLVGEGKGVDEGLPEMIASSTPDHSFAMKWLKADRETHKATAGWNGETLPLEQAWCVELMRRRMAITAGPGKGEREPRHYRLKVCPEPKAARWLAKHGVVHEFMRDVMARVERDHQRGIIWVGSAHYKPKLKPADREDDEWKRKAKCHAHFAFRGIDTAGRALFFEKKYIDRGFEWNARQSLHDMMGAGKAVRRAG